MDNSMSLESLLSMQGGDGDVSFDKNSFGAAAAIASSEQMLTSAIHSMELTQGVHIEIANLGLGDGGHTFSMVDTVVEVLRRKLAVINGGTEPELEVFFSDLRLSNRFFSSFRPLEDRVNDWGKKYYTYGTSLPFYMRLFPKGELHVVVTTSALQWLSLIPRKVMEKGSKTWNKGRVWIQGAEREVVEAYAEQSHKDLGSIEEDRRDAFNIPLYLRNTEEVTAAIESCGGFKIEKMELLKIADPMNARQQEFIKDPDSYGRAMANLVQVAQIKPKVEAYLGPDLTSTFYERYAIGAANNKEFLTKNSFYSMIAVSAIRISNKRLLVSLGSKPPLDTPQGTFMTSLTESYDKWFWVDSVIPLRIQYGNVGFQSHCLNSTIVSFSNSVKYIQRAVARHRGTGSSAASTSIPLWLIVKSITSPPPHRLIIPIPSERCWYSTDTCFGLNQNHLWSLNLPIVINLSHHSSSKASCLSTIRRRPSVKRVHLAQSRDVVLKLPLFVHPSQVSRVFISSDFVTGAIRFQGPSYLFVNVKSRIFILFGSVEIHIVSSWSLDVGARAVHARSTSFQTLPFGLINVGSDYFMLMVVTYSGIHLMLPTVLQWTSKTLSFSFVITCFMFCFMMFIKPSRIPSGSYLVTDEHSSGCNSLNSF
ncbi:hypothetical protein HID58_080626 [Brassica napus]|uniref:Uncharacterized protein n=1 Tax=Brassica napus TaxID=3708 RepID=A0ABQ7Y8K0_BRANA|nr:hypothetical protein HID58_080626 [Brassica napus]